ncbi:WSC domain-containing protein 1-like [Hyalella azteca]|uniref:WSC domain-containing protein 1-like n=1 Tax=Hyalella azteca TaxID=294128 RepID=A0A979FQR5_HYAAZ|nr:WSC domain-containing protein 1-like [Hyalella azteca]
MALLHADDLWFETRLGVDIPRVYLISFPRSGNTWTRYLVEGATGIFTGSVYTSYMLYNLGYLGEKQNITSNTTLLIKDHLFGDKSAPRDGPIVLIIRDPRNAITSYLAFKKARKMHKNPLIYNGPETLQIEDFEKDLGNYIDSWERVATKAMTNPTVLVLRYEDIKADPIRSVRKILAFLNIRPDEDRLACLARHVEGKVNRGQPELDIYTAEQEMIFSAAIARVSRLMESKGLPPLLYNS